MMPDESVRPNPATRTSGGEEEDSWVLSKKSGKMFRMEAGQEEEGVQVVVPHEVKGEVVSAFLNSQYSPTLHVECTREEIQSLEDFFRTCNIYDVSRHHDGFLLPFSYRDLTVKFRNNDLQWRGLAFTNIKDSRGRDLETKDISTGAVVSVSCSPFFYEMRSKDKRRAGNRDDYSPEGSSLRMDSITLVEHFLSLLGERKSCHDLAR